jgi:hypothetical protein
MQLLKVIGDGEVHFVDSDKPIKESLDPNECFIVNDDSERIVYLWKGGKSNVRSKFIGARKLQDVRGQVGLNYKSISLDEEEQPDYPDFEAAIEQVAGDGHAKEIRADDEVQFEIGGGPSKPKTYAQVMGSGNKFNESIEQSGPLYKGGDGPASSSSKDSGIKSFSKEELDKIIDTLDEDGIPEGFEREMVIMGDKAYSVAEKVQTFLGKKQVEKVLEPINSLPEGIFFAEGYVPRVLVQDKIVVAVEFLKKKE